MLHTRKAQTEEAQAAMAERNARRVEITKRAMGEKYAHHPDNHVQRLDSLKLRPYQVAAVDRIKRMGLVPLSVIRL